MLARTTAGLYRCQVEAAAAIFDLELDVIVVSVQAELGAPNLGVFSYIGECLLREAKQRDLYLRREPLRPQRFDVAYHQVLGLETVGVGVQAPRQAKVVQDRRQEPGQDP